MLGAERDDGRVRDRERQHRPERVQVAEEGDLPRQQDGDRRNAGEDDE